MSKKESQGKNWVFTLNNYTAEDCTLLSCSNSKWAEHHLGKTYFMWKREIGDVW